MGVKKKDASCCRKGNRLDDAPMAETSQTVPEDTEKTKDKRRRLKEYGTLGRELTQSKKKGQNTGMAPETPTSQTENSSQRKQSGKKTPNGVGMSTAIRGKNFNQA